MTRTKQETLDALLVRARDALGTKTEGMAHAIGSSKRTVERWFAKEADPTDAHVIQLARALYPLHPALAAEVAAAVGESLSTIGLVKPRPPPSHAHLIDAVVCVAAETIDAPSKALRPALLAAFRRARELGFTIEEAERALDAAAARTS
jgi:hypothetical protein